MTSYAPGMMSGTGGPSFAPPAPMRGGWDTFAPWYNAHKQYGPGIGENNSHGYHQEGNVYIAADGSRFILEEDSGPATPAPPPRPRAPLPDYIQALLTPQQRGENYPMHRDSIPYARAAQGAPDSRVVYDEASMASAHTDWLRQYDPSYRDPAAAAGTGANEKPFGQTIGNTPAAPAAAAPAAAAPVSAEWGQLNKNGGQAGQAPAAPQAGPAMAYGDQIKSEQESYDSLLKQYKAASSTNETAYRKMQGGGFTGGLLSDRYATPYGGSYSGGILGGDSTNQMLAPFGMSAPKDNSYQLPGAGAQANRFRSAWGGAFSNNNPFGAGI